MLGLNCNNYYHYFGRDMIVMGVDEQYILNEFQSRILTMLNHSLGIDEIASEFLKIVDDSTYKDIKFLIKDTINQMQQYNLISETDFKSSVKIYGEQNKYYPKKIVIELTNKCHLECVHCFKEAGPSRRNFVKAEDLLDFLEKLKGKVYEIQLTGGEPMAHPSFDKILKYVLENYKIVTITTTAHLINSRNIDKLKGISFVQVSLYHHTSEIQDKITNGKNSLSKTIRGIEYLNNAGIAYSVTNIVRNSLLDEFDKYIEFLIENNVKEVRFGLLSSLGRGRKTDSDWFLSKEAVEEFYDLLIKKNKEYRDLIKIHTWEEDCSTFFKDVTDNTMKCGAGVIEWTINENGFIKPCTFFPDSYYTSYSIGNFEDYVTCNHSDEIVSGINEWEKRLHSVGLSTKNICEEIYKVVGVPDEK